MNLSQWFRERLQTSADGFVWGVQQVPGARWYARPPEGLGEWSVARHAFHLGFYERTLALPSMRLWLEDVHPVTVAEEDEGAAWGDGQHDIDGLLAEFKAVRAEQVALVAQFDDAAWHAPRQAPWGEVTLLWVVSKTYQHTAEHTSDVLRIALFWDRAAARQEVASRAPSEG